VSYYAKQSGPEGATWLLIDGVAVATFWNPGGQALAETVAALLNGAVAGSATPTERDDYCCHDHDCAVHPVVAGSATPDEKGPTT
jgi:hypothetical protein